MERRPGTPARMLTRRQALAGLGFASGVLVSRRPAAAQLPARWFASVLRQRTPARATQQAAEGPFYLEETIERADVSDGRPGVPLELVLRLVGSKSCSPLAKARVDIWHADAAGCYSGFQGQGDERAISTVDKRFLRGTQYADDAGGLRFRTIYPGWYRGRTAHIHFKVFVDDKVVSVGQIYFPDDLNRFVFTTVPPYSTRRYRRDTRNRDDRVLASTVGRAPFAAVDVAPDRVIASLTVAVNE